VRCSPWPIKACHGDGEVEVYEVEVGGSVWKKMEEWRRLENLVERKGRKENRKKEKK